jgi:hypothetical protein
MRSAGWQEITAEDVAASSLGDSMSITDAAIVATTAMAVALEFMCESWKRVCRVVKDYTVGRGWEARLGKRDMDRVLFKSLRDLIRLSHGLG